MYEWFMEIGYEAEVNTKEDPELMALAELDCNEYQDTRGDKIIELRKMIFDRKECTPFRTDDDFLLRFLRAKRFIVPRAHKQLVRYCAFREQHKYLTEGVDLWGLSKLDQVFGGTMSDHPDIGRLTIFHLGAWDPYDNSIEELAQCAYAVVEIGLRQPKIQILGFTIIVDLEGLSIRHLSTFTPKHAALMVDILGVALPVKLKACHIINYSWMLSSFFYLFKKFIPKNAWDLIHFHGSDLNSLHEYIDPECLPARYGGTCKNTGNVGVWLKKIKKYRDEQFDREMKQLGYIIKE